MGTVRPYFPLVPDPSNQLKRVRSKTPEKNAWVIQWKDYKGKWRTSTKRGPKWKAKACLEQHKNETSAILNGTQLRPIKRMALEEVYECYHTHLRAVGRNPKTIERYRRSYTAIESVFSLSSEIREFTKQTIDRFCTHRLDNNCSRVGLNTDLRQLKAFFSWAHQNEYIDTNPFRQVKISSEIKPVRFLFTAEIIELLRVTKVNPNANGMVLFYLLTGARPGELLPEDGRFTWQNVRQDHIVIIGKRGIKRQVPLIPELSVFLESRKHLPHPFPYAYNTVYDWIVRNGMSKAGIENASLHTLRKTTGALLVQSGVDIYRVSKYLGHSTVTTTERHYAGLRAEDLTDIANTLRSILIPDTHMIHIEGSKMEHSGAMNNQNRESKMGSQVVHATDAGASMAMIINNLINGTRDRNRTGTLYKGEGF